MVFLQGLLTAFLKWILFNSLYDFAKNLSIYLAVNITQWNIDDFQYQYQYIENIDAGIDIEFRF